MLIYIYSIIFFKADHTKYREQSGNDLLKVLENFQVFNLRKTNQRDNQYDFTHLGDASNDQMINGKETPKQNFAKGLIEAYFKFIAWYTFIEQIQ